MAPHRISHREHLQGCLASQQLDRSPVALWRHFPVDDQTPAGLAEATLAFQRFYDFDLVKVTPASSFCLKDWGVQDEWRGDPEGTRAYTHHVVQDPEDWEHLPVLDPFKGHLGAQLECLRVLNQELGPDTPILQTVFSPLSQAKNLAGRDLLLVHLRHYPEAVLAGLRTIAEGTARFVEAARKVGIAGIFYAVQHARYELLSEAEYSAFGRELDLQVLEPAERLWLNMLHLHGSGIMFHLFADYPVQVINWHDRDTSPSLAEAQKLFHGAVCGGLRRETVSLGTPELVRQEAREALAATGGQRFILGTGCVVDIISPQGNLLAARKALDLLP